MHIKTRIVALEKTIGTRGFEVIVIGWANADLDRDFIAEETKEIQAARDTGIRRLILWRE